MVAFLINIFIELFGILSTLLYTGFKTSLKKDIEILALRSQLSLFKQQIDNKKIHKVKTTPAFRLLWIFISKYFDNWKSILIVVKPETVVKWHRKAFKLYWKRKSKHGRPCVSRQTIALIKRIHKENPFLSPEKIYEQLCNLNVSDAPSPNTIAKYIKDISYRKTASVMENLSFQSPEKSMGNGYVSCTYHII